MVLPDGIVGGAAAATVASMWSHAVESSRRVTLCMCLQVVGLILLAALQRRRRGIHISTMMRPEQVPAGATLAELRAARGTSLALTSQLEVCLVLVHVKATCTLLCQHGTLLQQEQGWTLRH